MTTVPSVTGRPARREPRGLFNSRRGRVLRENLIAYLLLSPAIVLIFTFGLFPVAFAFFVSVHQWRRFPGDYVGIDQYVRGLGDAAYVIFFWLALGAFAYGAWSLLRLFRLPTLSERARAAAYLLPGGVGAAAALLFLNWTAILLPLILNIPQRIRGQERVQGLFLSELAASFQFPEAVNAGSTFLIVLIAAVVLTLFCWRVIKGANADSYWLWALIGCLFVAVAALILQVTLSAVSDAVETARAAGTELPIWSQIILISAGAGMLAAAYWVWGRAMRAEHSSGLILKALAGVLLAAGGLILVMELPRALASADDDMLSGFGITIMFVVGTVPLQLAIGLFLAVLLFQNIKGKAMFRVVYFLPYIMPFVATSIVFGILFSHRADSPVNNLINALGIPDQKWLLEPQGIGRLLLGDGAGILAGPSLALIVIMLYTVWTYIGYDAVVFLAGLGNIPVELNEAARIDGANGWAIFRHITLPLLSPTTFFLSLIAIIGTFQAFTQIWIMRSPAAANSVDTIGVYIFETIRSTDPNYGYGSALSFVLFGAILIFTLVQNRIQGRRVFYG
ncbi:MAG: ABC transporter permease subunit [bacterium]|nr:ABC transporter permease subunit [bacterium]